MNFDLQLFADDPGPLPPGWVPAGTTGIQDLGSGQSLWTSDDQTMGTGQLFQMPDGGFAAWDPSTGNWINLEQGMASNGWSPFSGSSTPPPSSSSPPTNSQPVGPPPPSIDPVNNLPNPPPTPTGNVVGSGGGPQPGTPAPPTPPIITPPSTPPGQVARGVGLAVVNSVDNATAPKFAGILVNNRTPGESGYAVPQGAGPFAAGGTAGFSYFYNNSSGFGGSWCWVDLDAHAIINFTGGVSSSAPTPFYKAITDHLHSGTLNPDGFTNPQPVDLSASQSQNVLPYPQQTLAVQAIISSAGQVQAGVIGQGTLATLPTPQGIIGPTGGVFRTPIDTAAPTSSGTQLKLTTIQFSAANPGNSVLLTDPNGIVVYRFRGGVNVPAQTWFGTFSNISWSQYWPGAYEKATSSTVTMVGGQYTLTVTCGTGVFITNIPQFSYTETSPGSTIPLVDGTGNILLGMQSLLTQQIVTSTSVGTPNVNLTPSIGTLPFNTQSTQILSTVSQTANLTDSSFLGTSIIGNRSLQGSAVTGVNILPFRFNTNVPNIYTTPATFNWQPYWDDLMISSPRMYNVNVPYVPQNTPWGDTFPTSYTNNLLVGYWKLNDASGASAADSSGNGNTGIYFSGGGAGSIAYQQGMFGLPPLPGASVVCNNSLGTGPYIALPFGTTTGTPSTTMTTSGGPWAWGVIMAIQYVAPGIILQLQRVGIAYVSPLVSINSSNCMVASFWNGTSFTTFTTTAPLIVGAKYLISVFYNTSSGMTCNINRISNVSFSGIAGGTVAGTMVFPTYSATAGNYAALFVGANAPGISLTGVPNTTNVIVNRLAFFSSNSIFTNSFSAQYTATDFNSAIYYTGPAYDVSGLPVATPGINVSPLERCTMKMYFSGFPTRLSGSLYVTVSGGSNSPSASNTKYTTAMQSYVAQTFINPTTSASIANVIGSVPITVAGTYTSPLNTTAPISSGTAIVLDAITFSATNAGNSVTIKDPTGFVLYTTSNVGSVPSQNIWASTYCSGQYTVVVTLGGGVTITNSPSLHYFTQSQATSTVLSNIPGPVQVVQTSAITTAPTILTSGITPGNELTLTFPYVLAPSDANGSSSILVQLKDPNGNLVVFKDTGGSNVTTATVTAAGTCTYFNSTAIPGQYTWLIQAVCTNTGIGSSSYTVTAPYTSAFYYATPTGTHNTWGYENHSGVLSTVAIADSTYNTTSTQSEFIFGGSKTFIIRSDNIDSPTQIMTISTGADVIGI